MAGLRHERRNAESVEGWLGSLKLKLMEHQVYSKYRSDLQPITRPNVGDAEPSKQKEGHKNDEYGCEDGVANNGEAAVVEIPQGEGEGEEERPEGHAIGKAKECRSKNPIGLMSKSRSHKRPKQVRNSTPQQRSALTSGSSLRRVEGRKSPNLPPK